MPNQLLSSLPLSFPSMPLPRSAFDHSDRPQLDDLVRDAGGVAGVDHGGHVLVRLGRLLHDQLRRGDANGDALLGERVEHLLIAETPPRLVTTLRPARPVTC